MALSTDARANMQLAMVSDILGDEVSDAIDTGGNPIASNVAALGSTSDLSALVIVATSITAAGLSTGDSYTDAAVNGEIDTLMAEVETALDLKADNVDAETLRTEVEARMDAIEAKIDAVIAALVAAGIMAA